MRKKLLMITPENKEINRFRKRQFNNFIQLTMPYLAGFVDECKYEITLIDEYNQKVPYRKVYDLVAITVNTPNAAHCYRMADMFRKNGCKVVFGGPHATLLPDEAKEYCDYILVGEGEIIWPQFLEDFYSGVTKESYICVETPELNNLPLPRRDLIKKRFFTKGSVFATRGCPYNCDYCNLKQIYCNEFRKRPVKDVFEDVKGIKSKYFVFWDDNLFADRDYAIRLMQELKKLKKKWAAQVTMDKCEDIELLKSAKDSGCIYLFLGLESFSREGLASVNKEINCVDKYSRIIDNIHATGISVQAGIIFGFETDKKDIFDKTLKTCEELGIEGATVSMLTPFPGTSVYKKMKNEGRLLGENWTIYNGKTCVAFKPAKMSADELYQGYMRFRKEFYSLRSVFKRLSVSKTNILHNLITNIGYKLSL